MYLLPGTSAIHAPVSRRRLFWMLLLMAVLMIAIVAGAKSERLMPESSAVAGGCTPQFTEAVGSPVGFEDTPFSVAIGDFNSDGKQDLAAANRDANNVTIQLGDGMGGFTEPAGSPVNVGHGPLSVAVGDFNQDGKPDLATANVVPNNVTILIGDGTGGFTQATGSPVTVGDQPFSVAVGDFNNDGKQDLATANSNSDNVTILIGDGMGGFTQPTGSPITVGDSPLLVTVADFNNDGKPDLATANFNSHNVTILIGDGMGGFTEATGSPITVGSRPRAVAAGDFNRDGKPDLVTANSTSDNVTILIGDGMGGFTQATGSPVNVGDGPFSVAVGDFNRDGKQDLVTANFNSDNVTILLGDDMGGFTEPTGSPVNAGDGPASVAVGDFNNDGKQDLATANFNSDSGRILLNTCDAFPCGNTSFMQPTGSPVAVGSFPWPVAVGDFNRDGNEDLAEGNFQSNIVRILLGNGMGGFTEATGSPIAVEVGPISIAIGDFNRDGNEDLAVANHFSGKVTILLGAGTGGFAQAMGSPITVGAGTSSIAVGDFNRDGKQDLVTANSDSDNVTILLGNGTGGFAQATGSPITTGDAARSVAVGDFNQDGKQDLAVANQGSDNVTILLGNGTGGFTQGTGSPITVEDEPSSVAVGDFNRDGHQDLAVANYRAFKVTILLGNGMGGFTPATGSPINVGLYCLALAVGDLNLDGKQDLAVANSFDDSVTILIGNGMGGFTEPSGSPFATGQSTFSVAVGDFNRDGKQDLVTANHDSSNLTILLNTCSADADLSVTKTDLADPVMLGSNITYHITVKNNGPVNATGVVMTDKLPSSSAFVSAMPSTGTCSHSGSSTGGIVTCQIGNLSNQATATVNIVVQSRGNPGTISNTATVTGDQPDSGTSNNQASESTRLVGFRSFKFSPSIVTGGCQNSVGTLLFTSPAPAGVHISFTDNSSAIAPIASVTTVGGETSIQVTAVTSTVGGEQIANITAKSGTNSLTARLKLLPVRIASLMLSPNPVVGGQHVTGTVSLTCAPNTNVVVHLTSSKAAARLDTSTVTIHAGQTTAQFGITTQPVPSARDVVITAAANGGYLRATLRINP